MTTLRFWFRPAMFLFAWMLVAAFTLSELSTVLPLLASIGGEPHTIHEIRGRPMRARAQVIVRRTFAP